MPISPDCRDDCSTDHKQCSRRYLMIELVFVNGTIDNGNCNYPLRDGKNTFYDSVIDDEWMPHCVDYWSENKYYYGDMYNITIYVLSFDGIDRLISRDTNIFIMALVIMCLWLGFKKWLALSTVVIMVCALIVGFDLTGGFFGVPYNTIVLLGVGVDDSIIITDCWNNRSEIFGESGEIRLINTPKRSGISITLTSVSAFLIGTFEDILVKRICLNANYLFQFLLFIPLLVNSNTSLPNNNHNNTIEQRIKSTSIVEG